MVHEIIHDSYSHGYALVATYGLCSTHAQGCAPSGSLRSQAGKARGSRRFVFHRLLGTELSYFDTAMITLPHRGLRVCEEFKTQRGETQLDPVRSGPVRFDCLNNVRLSNLYLTLTTIAPHPPLPTPPYPPLMFFTCQFLKIMYS